MRTFVIVHGFGVVDMDKLFFQAYMSGVKKYIDDYNVDVVVCTGGYTVSDEISEAQSLKDTLINEYDCRQQEFLLEETAFSTFDNVQLCSKLIQKYVKENDIIDVNIVVCTANCHIYKSLYFSLLYYSRLLGNEMTDIKAVRMMQEFFLEYGQDHKFDGEINIELGEMHFCGIDVPWVSEQSWKQIVAALIEGAYPRFPELHQEFVEWRKEKWGRK